MYIFGVASSLFLLHLSTLVNCQDSSFLSAAAATARSFLFPSSPTLHSGPTDAGNPFLSPFSSPYSDRRDGLLVSSALANSLFSPHAAYADEAPFPIGAPPLMGPRSGPFSPLAGPPPTPFGAPPIAPFMGPGPDPFGLYGAPGAGSGPPPPSMFNLFSSPESAYSPYLAYSPSLSPISSFMGPSPLFSYLPRMSPFGGPMGGLMGGSMGQGYGSPKIEIGQKLSNSIYANNFDEIGENLRYDLSSFKDSSYSPSSSSSSSSPSSSSSSSRYPSTYSSQTNNLQSQPSSSSYSNPPSSSYQSDYALASNGYRQYLNQQQNLLSNPTLYNRISNYMPYMAPAMGNSGNSRSTDALYSKPSDFYKSPHLNSQASSASSLASSLSAAPSSSSSLESFSGQKGTKTAGGNKEELGFFKRSDGAAENSTKTSA